MPLVHIRPKHGTCCAGEERLRLPDLAEVPQPRQRLLDKLGRFFCKDSPSFLRDSYWHSSASKFP